MSASPQAPPRHDAGPERETGISIARVVLGGVLVVVGVLWLLDATGVLGLQWRTVLAGALVAVGIASLASARRGANGGLIATGIVLSVLLLVTSVTGFTGVAVGVGDRQEQPTSMVEVEDGYELGAGSLHVDLRELEDVEEGATIPISVGMGEVVVRLPEGLGADVEASVGMGEVIVLDRTRGGVGVSVSEEIEGDPSVTLEVSAGLGKVEVRR
jgi:hypothetical protein